LTIYYLKKVWTVICYLWAVNGWKSESRKVGKS